MKNTIVVAHSPGRMGNILVQLAHIAAFCIEYDVDLYAPTIADIGTVFARNYGSLGKLYPSQMETSSNRSTVHLEIKVIRKLRRLLVRKQTLAQTYGDLLGVVNLAGNKDTIDLESSEFASFIRRNCFTVLNGWRFRAPNLLLKHASEIKEIFKFKAEYFLATEKIFKPLQANSKVGVHIRLGDYRQTNYYYALESYIQLMQSAQLALNTSEFVVCSDEDIQSQIPNSLNCVFPKSTPIVDLLCLSKCDYIIGPPSTFSGWAAFIGNVPIYQIQESNFAPKNSDFVVNVAIDGPCKNPILVHLKEIHK
jgi:hypothetical protein